MRISTIYEADLEKHVSSRCPGLLLLGSDKPWYSKDCNAGEAELEEEIDEDVPIAVPISPKAEESVKEADTPAFVPLPEQQLKRHQKRVNLITTISPEVINDLITRLEGIWAVHEPNISEELIVTEHAPMDPSSSAVKIKHAIQNEAIIRHLKLAQMWNEDALYVEWGCGNAFLSQQLQQELHSDHIIIDRKTPKTKGDHKRDRSKIWKRITIDIKDIVLDAVPEVCQPRTSGENIVESTESPCRPLCSFSKHLCGAATDLTIRCLEQHQTVPNGTDSLLIALCCHHRCTWRSYVGRVFFEDVLGLTREDFDMMVRMSSWATSGDPAHSAPSDVANNELTHEEKKKWGWRCKRILDIGRVEYLKSLGYTAQFRYYVQPEVSLENILLVAHKSPASQASSSSGM